MPFILLSQLLKDKEEQKYLEGLVIYYKDILLTFSIKSYRYLEIFYFFHGLFRIKVSKLFKQYGIIWEILFSYYFSKILF